MHLLMPPGSKRTVSCAVQNLTMAFPEATVLKLTSVYERYGRHLPALVAAFFVILLGRALADLTWSLVPVPESARWSPPPVAATPATRDPNAVDINSLVNAHLFGQYQAPAVTDTTAADAPETALNLILVGLLADRDERYSRALIAVQNGEEKGYAVGDDITRGVTLQAIFPDRVILSRNGRLETLSLERDKPGAIGSSGVAPVAAFEDSPTQSSAQQLSQIRQEILQDPAKASEYVRVQPANVGGQLKGYRVYPGRDRAIFSSAGLRPGDLVTSVNGVQLDDPAKALQLLTDLSQAGQVNLVVERGGQSQNISINLN